MNFVLLIKSHPLTGAALSAFNFAEALTKSKHSLTQLFFYGDGVFTANCFATAPQDEFDLHASWAKLIMEFDLANTVCIASALRRGLLDDNEAHRYSKAAANVVAPFHLGGLGDLIDATHRGDRVVTFH